MNTTAFIRATRPISPFSGVATVAYAALAGGLGWGIRGQYGHETGAMMAGLLVSLVLVLRCGSHLPPWAAIRAVAMGTVAMGFGGSETYGQTIGLTQDAPLVGNAEALRWGLLGLSIKGALWIGFAGLFLGMGLGGVRYRGREILLLLLSFPLLQWIGTHFVNEPFDPDNHVLPRLYFSDSWQWEPGSDLKPRREIWAGLLLALAGGMAWTGFWKRDALARRLAGWGMLGGAVGFPLGQCLQSYHAWHPTRFRTGVWQHLDPNMNWWNWMETTFGCVMGFLLAFGLLRNLARIRAPKVDRVDWLPDPISWVLLAVHLVFLVLEEFASIRFFNVFYDPGFHLGLIPMLLATSGRNMAAWVAFVVTAVPIAGKTLERLAFEEPVVSLSTAVVAYALVPLAWTAALAWSWRETDDFGPSTAGAPERLAVALGANALLYFGLNSAFFRFPWPWETWTSRTPNFLFYSLALLVLGILSLRTWAKPPDAKPGRRR